MPVLEQCCGIDQIKEVAQKLLDHAHESVVVLRGDLAAGKTTLVKALAEMMGINETVSSPTFSLQQNYDDRLFHYDIYNHGLDHFMSLGLLEELERPGIHCVEWGDEALEKLLRASGLSVVTVEIEKQTKERCYRINYA